MVHAFAVHLDSSGWNPLEPSPESLAATRRPAMPTHLSELDRLGIHRKLVHIDLLRRFYDRLPTANHQHELRFLLTAATLHALRESGRDLRALSKEHYSDTLATLHRWEHTSLLESEERLNSARVASPMLLRPDGIYPEFEPMFTYSRLLFESDSTDFAGNCRSAEQAMRLGERRGRLSADPSWLASDLAGLKFTDAEVGELLDVMTSKNQAQHLFHVTRDGKFRLGARDARDAIESVIGAVEPVRQAQSDQLSDDVDLQDASNRDPGEDLAAQDELARVRQWLRDRCDDAAPGSPDAIVAENFERLMAQGLSIRELAKETGAPRSTLDRAAERLRAALAAYCSPQHEQ